MGKLKMLHSILWSKMCVVLSEGVKVDRIPGPLVPTETVLNVLAMVISVDMEADTTGIVLACNRTTVDVNGDLLVGSMVNIFNCAKLSVLSLSCSQEVSINIQTSRRQWKFIVLSWCALTHQAVNGLLSLQQLEVMMDRRSESGGMHLEHFPRPQNLRSKSTDRRGAVSVPEERLLMVNAPQGRKR